MWGDWNQTLITINNIIQSGYEDQQKEMGSLKHQINKLTKQVLNTTKETIRKTLVREKLVEVLEFTRINHVVLQSLKVRRHFARETEAKDLQKC